MDVLDMLKGKTVYLIDSENVNDNWIEVVADKKKNDEVYVFYTEKSANLSCENLSKLSDAPNNVIWKKCFTGQNALDFQLVTEIGYMIAKKPKDKYVIVANDKGYEAVVNYWLIKGIDIKRIEVETAQKKTKPKGKTTTRNTKTTRNTRNTKTTTKETKTSAKTAPKKTSKTTETKTGDNAKQKQSGTRSQRWTAPKGEDAYAKAIGKSVSVQKMGTYYEALTYLFGQKRGTAIYHNIREDNEWKENVSKTYLGDKNKRIENYINLFLSRNALSLSDAKKIKNIILKTNSEDLNGLYQALVETFGEEQGRTYYNIFKSSLRIIKTI